MPGDCWYYALPRISCTHIPCIGNVRYEAFRPVLIKGHCCDLEHVSIHTSLPHILYGMPPAKSYILPNLFPSIKVEIRSSISLCKSECGKDKMEKGHFYYRQLLWKACGFVVRQRWVSKQIDFSFNVISNSFESKLHPLLLKQPYFNSPAK